ncbi:MAG: amidohydrolase family protein [Chloroflexi bacterium]|nr:amidohydrolase family protein [Chloroflexota bacterium]
MNATPSLQGSTVDLLIRAGRVFCAATGLDGPGAVAIQGDRIVAAGSHVTVEARQTLDFPDALLLPGLIDLHAHPAVEGSKFGIAPDLHLLPRGVTTVLSQGDAGAYNWPHYRTTTIDASATRVRLAINLSARGESMPGPCLADVNDMDVEACVTAIADGGDLIWGIAVNISTPACGDTDPRLILARALEVAERTQRPLLFGSRRMPDFTLAEQLALLRPGDVLTYCFNDFNNELDALVRDGVVREEVWDARARGILFDVGHGMQSFSFPIAETAIAQGFFPDTISTDQYARHVGSIPQHDLARTLSKFLAIGLPEEEAWARVTYRPAQVLGLADEIGTLAPGSCADLAVLHWNSTALPLRDVNGVERPGGCWEPVRTVRAGRLID